jgi:twitching motility protein PilT
MTNEIEVPMLEEVISKAVEKQASDIHIVADRKPYLRIADELVRMEDMDVFTDDKVRDIAEDVLSEKDTKVLETAGDVDVGVAVGGVGLRVNIHEQSGGLGMAMRIVPEEIPAPDELNFHETLLRIPEMEDGLVLFTGPAGSGKSTSMAALVNEMNKMDARHIITLEDPIEYRHKDDKSLIEQRELGRHFESFPGGLRHVLRQDPDVIVVGEMRDPETIELALTAAETGHLVISTLHTPNAPEAVERIINVYEGAEQAQIMTQLAATLRMVVAQKLLPRKDDGLLAVWEILVTNTAIKNAIRQNKLATIRSAIQTGKEQGMITLERSVKENADLLTEEVVERWTDK